MGVFWKQERIVIKMVATTFTVEVLIRDHKLDISWWCVGVCTSTNDRIRKNNGKSYKKRADCGVTVGF